MSSIFISYAREDRPFVDKLRDSLRRAGHNVWTDEKIATGEEFDPTIFSELSGVDVIVVCWSRASVKSPWVLAEASCGKFRGVLLPLSLDGTKAPTGFSQFQTQQVRSSGRIDKEDLSNIKRGIGKIIRKKEGNIELSMIVLWLSAIIGATCVVTLASYFYEQKFIEGWPLLVHPSNMSGPHIPNYAADPFALRHYDLMPRLVSTFLIYLILSVPAFLWRQRFLEVHVFRLLSFTGIGLGMLAIISLSGPGPKMHPFPLSGGITSVINFPVDAAALLVFVAAVLYFLAATVGSIVRLVAHKFRRS